MPSKGKVCLAYSGGLDTSCILKWLLEQGYEVVCFLANVGQEEDWEAVRKKAMTIGASKMVIMDLRREFVESLCFRATQCNAIYEGRYLLGTSLARPVIARAQMKVAAEEGCQFLSHGCTGKGNDQVRLELAYLAIDPKIKIIAPWRIPEFFEHFKGRGDLLDYAAATGVPVSQSKAKPYSIDANLAHISYESGSLEDPSKPPPNDMWLMTDDPTRAPAEPQDVTISFEKGIPIKVSTQGKSITDSLELFTALNQIGKVHGIGRIDIVENRFIGLKSRGCYEQPAMTILRAAHLDLEGLVLDGRVRSIRDRLAQDWAELIYNGLYFSPEQDFVAHALEYAQKRVNGEVRLRCYRGSCYILGRWSETEKLYSESESSMDSLEDFSPVATSGFIEINAIRLKKYGLQKQEDGQSLVDW